MGWAVRAKEMEMGRGFMTSRRDLVARLAQVAQHVAGAAGVSLIVTWADEDEEAQMMNGDTHSSSCYGETSVGRPIASLGIEDAQRIALAHLDEAARMLTGQGAAIRDQMVKRAAAGDNGGGHPITELPESAGGGDCTPPAPEEPPKKDEDPPLVHPAPEERDDE